MYNWCWFYIFDIFSMFTLGIRTSFRIIKPMIKPLCKKRESKLIIDEWISGGYLKFFIFYHPLQNSIAIKGLSGWTSRSRLKIESGFDWKFAVWRIPSRVPPMPSPPKLLSDVKNKLSSPFSKNDCLINSRYSLLFGLNKGK